MKRVDLPTLRAAWWAFRALRSTRRRLRRDAIVDIAVAAPPRLPEEAIRGVRATLRRRPHTCLEEALVLQRWFADHGTLRDVVIGVTAPDEDFGAHAWLDGHARPEDAAFSELTRLRPSAAP